MSRFYKFFAAISIILILIIKTGSAQEKIFPYIDISQQNYYPEDNIDITFGAEIKTGEKSLDKNAVIALYRFDSEKGEENIKTLVKNVKPLKTLKKKIFFRREKASANLQRVQKKILLTDLPPGYYIVKLNFGKNREESYASFKITRLGLIAKTDGENLLIFLQDAKTGRPLNARLRIYNPKTPDGTTSFHANSGWSGLKTFKLEEIPKYKKGEDLIVEAYLNKDSISATIHTFKDTPRLKGYIYTDRPIYQPGQKIYISGILRMANSEKTETPEHQNVNLIISNPQGVITEKASLTTNHFGCLSYDTTLKKKIPPGSYKIRIIYEKQYIEGNFTVTKQINPQINITVTPSKKRYTQKENPEAEITIRNNLGEPLPLRKFTYTLKRIRYYNNQTSQDKKYNTDISAENTTGRIITRGNGKTDKKGKARIYLILPPALFDSLYTLEVKPQIDKNIQKNTGSGEFITTQGDFTLTVNPESYIVNAGKETAALVETTDYDGNPLRTDIKLKITRIYYDEHKKIDESENISNIKIPTNFKGIRQFYFIAKKEGYYQIEAEATDKNDNKILAKNSFYCAGKDSPDIWYDFKKLEIISDKSSYKNMEMARIFFTFPQKGANILVTLEGKKIYRHLLYNAKGNSLLINLPIRREYAPCTHLTLSYFYGGQFFTATQKIIVKDEENFIQLKIKPDKTVYKPRDEVKLNIQALNWEDKPLSALVTVAVTDESIRENAGKAPSSLENYLCGLQDNLVDTFNTDYNEKNQNKATKTHSLQNTNFTKKYDYTEKFTPGTCYFNTGVITDHEGKACVSFSLPDELTTWRVTTRGVTRKSQTGENSIKFAVKTNLLAKIIAPPFMVEGDEAVVTGIIYNYLDKNKKIKVNLRGKGLKILSPGGGSGVVPSGGAENFLWKIKADKIGEAIIRIQASTFLESDEITAKIPILPRKSPEKCDKFLVERRYFLTEEEKSPSPLNKGAQLKTGERILVKIAFSSDANCKNILVEDPIPAGFQADNETANPQINGKSADMEISDKKVFFAIDNLSGPQNFEIQYYLQAKIPGKFTALPATVKPKKSAKIAGKSDKFQINIEGAPRQDTKNWQEEPIDKETLLMIITTGQICSLFYYI